VGTVGSDCSAATASGALVDATFSESPLDFGGGVLPQASSDESAQGTKKKQRRLMGRKRCLTPKGKSSRRDERVIVHVLYPLQLFTIAPENAAACANVRTKRVGSIWSSQVFDGVLG
jgi:hypothetical protein